MHLGVRFRSPQKHLRRSIWGRLNSKVLQQNPLIANVINGGQRCSAKLKEEHKLLLQIPQQDRICSVLSTAGCRCVVTSVL